MECLTLNFHRYLSAMYCKVLKITYYVLNIIGNIFILNNEKTIDVSVVNTNSNAATSRRRIRFLKQKFTNENAVLKIARTDEEFLKKYKVIDYKKSKKIIKRYYPGGKIKIPHLKTNVYGNTFQRFTKLVEENDQISVLSQLKYAFQCGGSAFVSIVGAAL
jgi:hypothetical protein